MQPTLHIYIWSLFQIFIFFKVLSNSVLQLTSRKRGDTAADTRMANLWRNDLENIVPFDFLFLAAAIVQINAYLYIAIGLIFVVARLSHAFGMVKEVMPARGFGYASGMVCMLILSIAVLIRLIPIFSSY